MIEKRQMIPEMAKFVSLLLAFTILTIAIVVSFSFSSKKLENGLLLGYILARKSPVYMM